jgi:hypothetical protein
MCETPPNNVSDVHYNTFMMFDRRTCDNHKYFFARSIFVRAGRALSRAARVCEAFSKDEVHQYNIFMTADRREGVTAATISRSTS